MFLRVHPSNFRIEGFTERPSLGDLVAARARRSNVPVVEDIGSGCLVGRISPDEPSVQASIARRRRLVCFSGDKLLGGPQCGIIAGRKAMIDRLRTHPLMRALRADKITLAMLEATLAEYCAGTRGIDDAGAADVAPVAEEIEARAQALAATLPRQRVARRADQRHRPRSAAAARPACNCRRCCCRLRRTASRPMRPSDGCGRSIRRSSPASNTIASSSICGPCCRNRTMR